MQCNLIGTELEKYFFNIPLDCPYSLPHQAIYRQAQLGRMPDPVMERFVAAGFRRSGSCIYTMGCKTCHSCVPIRLDPLAFRTNRSQRRTLNRNRDVEITTGPLSADSESLQLCEAFLRTRYPGRGNSAEEYYFGFFANLVTDTFEIRYSVSGRLLGVAVIDIGSRWLNAVYFFFDPQEAQRGLGTFNILTLINHCRQWQIHRLYLGYWIKEISAMSYKANFKPHELLIDGCWQTIDTDRLSAANSQEPT